MDRNPLKYVLITPARNEEKFIEGTIKSVILQSLKPVRWIIVSDGSTDGTDEIVKLYQESNRWIELIRMPDHRDRQFAAKAKCFNSGYEKIKNINYDIIGNLDADISFGNDYFEYLMERFNENPKLGVAGTPFVEENFKSFSGEFSDLNHVSGACQLFRKKCFEQIGGYVQIKGGGIDWIAVTTARMKGWKTKTFTEKVCYHHRKMGTGNNGYLMSRFNHGRKDFYLGGHPLWEIFRGIYQMFKKPYISAGSFLLAGFFSSYFKKIECPLSPDLKKFHRTEQMQRLKGFALKLIKKKR